MSEQPYGDWPRPVSGRDVGLAVLVA